jgi:hypothetical protein
MKTTWKKRTTSKITKNEDLKKLKINKDNLKKTNDDCLKKIKIEDDLKKIKK